MRRSTAAIGSAVDFVGGGGDVRVLIPWLATGWQFHRPWPLLAQVAGVLLIGAGLVPVVGAFVQFARAGGTPLPVAPTPAPDGGRGHDGGAAAGAADHGGEVAGVAGVALNGVLVHGDDVGGAT